MFFPLVILVGLLFSISNAIVIRDADPGQFVDRSFNGCNKYLPYQILSQLKASQFCTDFLKIKTQTVTKTSTTVLIVPTITSTTTTQLSQFTALETRTVFDTFTQTNTVTGPATSTTITSTITDTEVTEITIFATSTTIVTSASAIADNNRKRDLEERPDKKFITPNQLKIFAANVISTACSCYATTPTATVQAVVTTSTASVSTVVFTTIKAVARATQTQTESRTNTLTVTQSVPSRTETAIELTTTTLVLPTTTTELTLATSIVPVVGRTYKLRSEGSGCVYNRYIDYNFDGPVYENDNTIVQYCASVCARLDNCRFFHGYRNKEPYGSAPAGAVFCILDDKPFEAGNGGSTLQCGLFFAGRYLSYDLVA